MIFPGKSSLAALPEWMGAIHIGLQADAGKASDQHGSNIQYVRVPW